MHCRKGRGIVAIIGMVAALVVSPSPSVAQGLDVARGPAMVVLVRHADRAAAPADDPPLSAAGTKRAQDLATALHDAGVTAIVTTQLRRTRDTAAPLAAKLGLMPEVVPTQSATAEHIKAVQEAVRRHIPGVVLVVGHSDTVHLLIAAFGGPQMRTICVSVYDNLFVLYQASGKTGLLHTKYGAPTPENGPDCR